MVIDPTFVSVAQVLEQHDRHLARFGGASGVRDVGLLESAVLQPLNLFSYDLSSDFYDLAAAYAYHIAKNHIR